MKNKWKYYLILIVLVLMLIINYFALIPLNLRIFDTFILFLVFILFLILLFAKEKNFYKVKNVNISGQIYETKVPSFFVTYIVLGFILSISIYALFSSPIIFASKYKNLIGDVSEKDFTEDFEVVNNSELPIVDYTYASKLGDKKLGADRGLGSEYHVGEFTDITVKGRMKMVAPLEFNGFFKWLNNGTTPGYVMVDKITSEVELVTEINGKKLELKYLDTAYFNNDLKRHVYMNGHAFDELYQYNFEIDDDGNPYYIVTKTKKIIGIAGGRDVKSILTVDIQTGEIKEYSLDEVPDWVDTVYPNELVLEQIDNWGLYVNGFWNTIFDEKDIVRITEGTRVVYNNGSLYHYTGLTSAGSDESTVGFMFVNMQTKEASFYKMIGATEYSAMQSAEGKVENYGYKAAFPIPTNIREVPTFFMTLKDSSGLIKQYAFVNIEDFSIVGTGETINDALNTYLKALDKEYIGDDTQTYDVEGTIKRIGFDVNDGNTTYYIILEEDNKLYYGSSTINREINISNVGDKIKISVNNNRIVNFDNLNI